MSDILATTPAHSQPIRFSTRFNAPPMIEVFPGEVIALFGEGALIESVTIVDSPAGAPPAMNSGASPTCVAPSELGRYHLRVRTTDGVETDVAVILCETAVLACIPDQQRSGGAPVDKRRVLRELARYDQSFTGRAAELANKPLANFGAG